MHGAGPAARDRVSSIVFLGDVFLEQPYVLEPPLDGVVVFNLEGPITRARRGVPGKVNLRVESNHLRRTFGESRLVACLANNHVLDYGAEGLRDTVEELAAARIQHFGAGLLAEGCGNGLIIDVGGVAVGLLGYVCPTTGAVFASDDRPGVLPIDVERIREDMAEVRRRGAERIVVCMHWGAEEVYLPRPQDRERARAVIASGADLVIGHHAHRIQPWERYRGRYIFYGLGNFVMPDLAVPAYFDAAGEPGRQYVKRQRRWNWESLVVRFYPRENELELLRTELDGLSVRARPVRKGRYRLRAPRLPGYGSRYRLSYLSGMLRVAMAAYLERPRLPSRRQLRYVLDLLRSPAR